MVRNRIEMDTFRVETLKVNSTIRSAVYMYVDPLYIPDAVLEISSIRDLYAGKLDLHTE